MTATQCLFRMTVGGVTIRLESWSAALAALENDWLALEARALEPNALLCPLFMVPAARHLVSPYRAPGC